MFLPWVASEHTPNRQIKTLKKSIFFKGLLAILRASRQELARIVRF